MTPSPPNIIYIKVTVKPPALQKKPSIVQKPLNFPQQRSYTESIPSINRFHGEHLSMFCEHQYVTGPDHRNFIDSVEHNHCVLCLIEDKGALTQEEIGSYLKITKEAVHQLEKRALRKFKKKLNVRLPELFQDGTKFAQGSSEIEYSITLPDKSHRIAHRTVNSSGYE